MTQRGQFLASLLAGTTASANNRVKWCKWVSVLGLGLGLGISYLRRRPRQTSSRQSSSILAQPRVEFLNYIHVFLRYPVSLSYDIAEPQLAVNLPSSPATPRRVFLSVLPATTAPRHRHGRHAFHPVVDQPAAPSRLSHAECLSLTATEEGEAEPVRHAQAVRALLPDASWGGLVAAWLRGRILWWKPRGPRRRQQLDDELTTDSRETEALRQRGLDLGTSAATTRALDKADANRAERPPVQ